MKKYNYTYRITNKIEGKHYYGKRSTDTIPSQHLGVKYFSSSKDVEFIKDQKNNPQNYKYKIIKMHDSAKAAIEHEIVLHNKFNVGKNTKFYNRCKQSAKGFDTTGIKFSEARIQKCRESRKGFKHTEESKEKCRQVKLGNTWNIGRKHTKEAIELMKKNTKKGVNSPNAVLVDVYKYGTDQIVATKVSLSEWCKDNKSLRSNLAATLRADRSKPSNKYNPWQAKGYYAKYSNA